MSLSDKLPAPPKVLVLQNHPVEGLDAIEAYLGEHKIPYQVHRAYENEVEIPSNRNIEKKLKMRL